MIERSRVPIVTLILIVVLAGIYLSRKGSA